jgi:NAD(P)-dependent dehydrogenase (short-subunit alcohol dehydrogenase family)
MNEPDLRDPRTMYYTEKFPQQQQETPALQSKMDPKPDCGEDTYVGHELLLNRKVLVTGGDSGIGRATAIAMAREGADVAIQYFPGEDEDAQEVADYIKKAGRRSLLLPYDFRDETAPQAVVDRVVAEFGGLDTLILNASQQIAHSKIEDLPIKQVKDSFEVNVVTMIALVKAAKPHLPAGGAIVTTTSIQAFNPSPQLLDYAATKAAIANLTINWGQQLIEDGIRVNGVAPGPIWTPIQLDHGQPEAKIPEFGQNSPMGRAGQPAELAPVYVFLASNLASYVTAQIYGVTGGEPINM